MAGWAKSYCLRGDPACHHHIWHRTNTLHLGWIHQGLNRRLLYVSPRLEAAKNGVWAERDTRSMCGFGFARSFDFLIWAIFLQHVNHQDIDSEWRFSSWGPVLQCIPEEAVPPACEFELSCQKWCEPHGMWVLNRVASLSHKVEFFVSTHLSWSWSPLEQGLSLVYFSFLRTRSYAGHMSWLSKSVART